MTDVVREFDLTTEPCEDHLYAHVRTVAMTPRLYRTLFKDIRDVVLENRAGRLLIEYEAAHVLTEHETFELMEELVKVMPGMRIAIVARDPKHRPSLNVSAFVGIETGEEIRSFTDPAVAEEWLLGDQVD
jgi:hypothetical protein